MGTGDYLRTAVGAAAGGGADGVVVVETKVKQNGNQSCRFCFYALSL
jgi:hypothetical protein